MGRHSKEKRKIKISNIILLILVLIAIILIVTIGRIISNRNQNDENLKQVIHVTSSRSM